MLYPELYVLFGDGTGLTTVTRRQAAAIDTYPGKTLWYQGDRPVPQLWEAHRERAERLAAERGGYSTEMVEDYLFTHLRADTRRYCDFQVARGLLVPQSAAPAAVAAPVPPPPREGQP